MNKEIEEYLQKYPEEIIQLFLQVRKIVLKEKVVEKMWAKLPSYYVEKRFIRIIPFKDHLNIEASGVKKFTNELADYNITAKNMLQLYPFQKVPVEILTEICQETLNV